MNTVAEKTQVNQADLLDQGNHKQRLVRIAEETLNENRQLGSALAEVAAISPALTTSFLYAIENLARGRLRQGMPSVVRNRVNALLSDIIDEINEQGD